MNFIFHCIMVPDIYYLQVLVRLCNHVSPAEELARKDDLSLLFSAITSWCPSHNIIWRKSAGEVLVTLSRHGLTQTVVKYIHGMLNNYLVKTFFNGTSNTGREYFAY